MSIQNKIVTTGRWFVQVSVRLSHRKDKELVALKKQRHGFDLLITILISLLWSTHQ